MTAFTSQTFRANDLDIHAKVGGPEDAPVMVMLHGFPEYWVSWAAVAKHFLDTYRIIMPDQRGFNLSSKPEGVEAYDTKHMVADLADLVDQVSPGAPIILAGHDWGASVAYAFAMRHADRVSKLIIANGVHPMCFQKALYAGGPQTDASQYINLLRTEDVEDRLARENFTPLLGMFEKFSAAPWLTDEVRDAYRAAWSQEGALTSMVNWYRASPLTVPESGTKGSNFPITSEMEAKYRIAIPHLLLWGQQDTALLPEAREGLDRFCEDLTIEEAEDASHWILQEKPDWVAERMKEFLSP